MLVFLYIYLSVFGSCFAEISTTVEGSSSKLENASPPVTQTVYGFLDFTTTIGKTVMVFSPQSAATTSTKPQEQVTIIKEKPQTWKPVVEILPSKAKTHSQIDQEDANEKDSALSFSTILIANPADDLNQHTTEVSKITTINVKNTTTTTKNKSGKSLPLSLPVSTISSKSIVKEKFKSGTKQSAIIRQVESSDEANSFKKLTQKSHSTTKPSTNIKTDKTSHNVTSKSKTVSKTEKPKITVKSSSKPASTVFNPQSPVFPQEHINQSVIVASKVKVREGSISVHKVKKPDAKANNAKTPASSSVVEGKKGSEKENSSETNILLEQEKRKQISFISEEPAIISSSDVSAPEYDYLSRQPSEVVDETFRVIDLKPNLGKYQKGISFHRTTPANIYEETQPLGLITSLTDSMIKDGMTTVFETNIIGTVISGKYAQVLQSNSHIQQNGKKIKPSSAVRILKTVRPTNKGSPWVPNLEATPVYEEDSSSVPIEVLYNGEQGIKPSRKLSLTNNNYAKNKFAPSKNKFKDDYRDEYGNTSPEGEEEGFDIDYSNTTSPSYQSSTLKKTAATKKSSYNGRPFKLQNNRFNRPTTPELATVSVFSEDQSSVTPSYSNSVNRRFSPSNRRTTVKPVASTETQKIYVNTKRSYKTKVGPSNIGNNNIDLPVTPPTYKFKLARPSGRWQYKTSPKPRVTIRRQDENLDNATANSVLQFTSDVLKGSNQELSVSGIYPALQHGDNSVVEDIAPSVTAETLRVEISTPADFKDVYYEIATIKSPYSFQVGSVKNTRFITVTSTIEKSLLQQTESPSIQKSEPLSENILASTDNAYDKEPPLDSSIATLPPIKLAGDAETPPLETMTESFSTTQLMLKTHILPVIQEGSNTTRYTLVQSYHVTRLVTATKTLPPMEVYQFVPSKTLNEFNTRLDEAGSEVHLELEFGDSNEQDDESPPNVAKALLSELDLTNVGSNFDIADVDKNKILEQHLHAKKLHHKLTTSTTPQPTEAPTTPTINPEQLQQLAILRLLNPNAVIPNLITSSRPVIKIETAYDTHVLPIFNGGSTFFTTISRPTATLTKTAYEVVTNTLPAHQSSIFNPLFPQPSIQVATTPFVTQTLVTQTNSKVLKLTFGAKTSYTTLFSTKVTPTVLTTYLTNSIPVQPTVAPFSGFFNPALYGFNPPYPFVG